jgi:hypothetical protein
MAGDNPIGLSTAIRERVSRLLVHVPGWTEAKIWEYIQEAYEEGLADGGGTHA